MGFVHMWKRALLLVLALCSSVSLAQDGFIAPRDAKLLNALSAGSNQTSVGKDVIRFNTASVQAVWSGLTGTVDGTVKVQVSNDCTNWTDKSGASVTLSGAAGTDLISIANLTEACLRLVYTKNQITGGTITALLGAKG